MAAASNFVSSSIVNKVEEDTAEEELRDKAERAAALSTPIRPGALRTRLENVTYKPRKPRSFDDEYKPPVDYWLPEPPYRRPSEPAPDFLNDSPRGNATLTYNDEHGEIQTIADLNLEIIEQRSPLIAAAFEGSPSRSSRLHLDLLTPLNAMPFLRFLYTGTYAEFEYYEDVPTSLLLHCQLYHLAAVYDLDTLRTQALVNVYRQCEFGCSSPEKPIDLCAAVSFAYQHIVDRVRVMDVVVHYCVTRFCDHSLGHDDAFRKLAGESRPFHLDLVRICRERGFEDEAAMDIIQLPYNGKDPASFASTEDTTNPRIRNVIQRLQQVEVDGTHPYASKHDGKQRVKSSHPPTVSALTLALRQVSSGSERGKQRLKASREDTADTLSSEDEGFQMVDTKDRRSSADTDASTRPLYKHTPSDSDYVMLPGPADVETADTSDLSDTSTLVDVTCPATTAGGILVSTSSRPPGSTRESAAAHTDPESDWEML